MKSLFIIGNGFDISHGLKTSYEDFHIYLNTTYPNARINSNESRSVFYANNQKFPLERNENVGFIDQVFSEMVGSTWNDIEYAIGHINYKQNILSYYDGLQSENWEKYFYGDHAIFLMFPILQIFDLFSEWISTIEFNKITPKKDFIRLINKEKDLFLSFNYTKTLEYLYGIQNICHIHGKQGEELIFGHSSDYNLDAIDFRNLSLNAFFEDVHEKLRKDTAKALNNHKTFFKTLGPSIDKVFSYGFSFSKVDEIYIKQICKQLNTEKVIWYLNDFDDNVTRSIYESVIIKCGFKGSFDVYNIKD